MIGQNINAYFDAAMMYPVERLEAVIRGQDKSIPAAAAMMALPLKQREMAAAGGMQAMQQPQQPSVRQQMAQATMPQMAPQSPQGMRQIPQQSPQQVAQLPENTGVMNLPAPNMQNMADGGIVAFAGEDESLVKQEEKDRADLEYGLRHFGAAAKDVFSMPGRAVAGAAESVVTRPLRAVGVPVPYLPDAFYGGDRASPTPYVDALRREEAAKTPAAATSTPAAPAAQTEADAWKKYATDTKPKPAVEKKKEPGIGGISKPSTGVASGSYEDYLKKVSAGDKDLLGEYSKLGKEETAGMEALLKEKQDAKPGGKAGESLEKYLKGKEAADVGKRAENINNAFVNAGFTIATSDSPSFLTNLAKGGKEGTASYKAGIEKLDAAADERAKMFASIEDARRAEAKGDWKELYAAKEDIKKSEFAYRKYGIDALVKLTGENRKTAAQMYDVAQTNKAHLQAVGITAGASRENAAATREATGAYRQGQLRQDALALGQKMLDEKMKQFQLDKLTMTPEVYEQWRTHYNKLAFNQMEIPQPGTTTASNNVFADPKEQAAYSKFAGT